MKDELKNLTTEQLAVIDDVFEKMNEADKSEDVIKNTPKTLEAELTAPIDKASIVPEASAAAPDSPGNNCEVPWVKDNRINEVLFCRYFIAKHPVIYEMNSFFDENGICSREKIENEIFYDISPYVTSGIARKVSSLMDAIMMMARCDDMPLYDDRVNFNNGTLYLEDMHFSESKELCVNRLPVAYNKDAKNPEKWLGFLNELLYEEDIVTLQEFMGYTLIPTTRAQSMLLIIGNGGEGKSRVALVLRAILGDNMNVCPLDKLAKDRFCRADQEGKLLMIDDDMKMEAMSETNIIKAVVTMEGTMDLERKGKQSVQGKLFVRLMGLGNGNLSALYDKSDGFYRRQIVLRTKEKPADRKDDRMLIDKLTAEKEGIVLWCLHGLRRLRDNDFHFTVSERAKQNLEESKKEDENFIEFFESDGYIKLEKDTHAATKDIYVAYTMWCKDNLERPRSEKAFSKYIKQNAEKMKLIYDKNIDLGYGKKGRGYYGIHVKVRTDISQYSF